jgi:hypothetical protein
MLHTTRRRECSIQHRRRTEAAEDTLYPAAVIKPVAVIIINPAAAIKDKDKADVAAEVRPVLLEARVEHLLMGRAHQPPEEQAQGPVRQTRDDRHVPGPHDTPRYPQEPRHLLPNPIDHQVAEGARNAVPSKTSTTPPKEAPVKDAVNEDEEGAAEEQVLLGPSSSYSSLVGALCRPTER